MSTLSLNKKAANDPNILPFRFALKAYVKEEKLKIPTLPDIVAQVLELINKPSVNANTLARLIHKDQALAGYVLRVSNSPVYAGSKEILTLRQAIARIGARTLGKITVSVAMQGDIFKADTYSDEMDRIWRQSLTAGSLAQDIGKLIGYNTEALYLCGLLHSVGKPVILQAIDILKQELKLDLSYQGGIALMDEFHAEVGGRVAVEWKLPEPVKVAALNYAHPERADVYQKEVLITHVAHLVASFLDEEVEEEYIEKLAQSPHLQELNLDAKKLNKLFSRLEKIQEFLDQMKP